MAEKSLYQIAEEMRAFIADNRDFVEAEIERINKEKWYEGERIHDKTGDLYVSKLIELHGPEWRDLWNRGCCKHCQKHHECGYNLRLECTEYRVSEVSINSIT